MQKSNKVLIFTTAYRPLIGGSELAINEIIKRLPDWFFEIITPRLKRGLPAIETAENYRIHRVGLGFEKIDKFLFPLLGFNYAKKLLKKDEYRLIHAFQASHAAGAAWRLKRKRKHLPLVVTLQEGKNLERQSWFIKFARKRILSEADRITAISEYLKKYARSVKKNARVVVIPNGVDMGNFSREFSYGELTELRDKLGIKPDEKVIISVSRLVQKNGLDDLVKAFAILDPGNTTRPLKLLLVGDGPEKESLKLKIENLELGEKIIFAGNVGHDELPKFLKISDVFARPSLSEGLGSAFLEAMAAGVPVIGTNVGGIPDFLKDPLSSSDRATGLFCLPGNPQSLAEKIHLLLSDPDLRQRIVANASDLVKEKYDWHKIAAEYEKLYLGFC